MGYGNPCCMRASIVGPGGGSDSEPMGSTLDMRLRNALEDSLGNLLGTQEAPHQRGYQDKDTLGSLHRHISVVCGVRIAWKLYR